MWSVKFRNVGSVVLLGILTAGLALALEPGDTLPKWGDFELEGKVPDLEGKVVMVDVWASWCAPCKASFPAYAKLQQEWADQGFVILGISVDKKSKDYARFLKQTPPGFSTVRDVSQKLAATLKPPAMPTSFIFGRDGKLRKVHKGYRGDRTVELLRSEIEPLLAESP
ncbi:MAG: TlpA family protein disulfide reductase [Opitutaceae bacterium]|jgi:thiol-disulfide isomerase/thioredoxin|nr:TlpA family protein disulfide reductase [Opitutaceae bacterium]